VPPAQSVHSAEPGAAAKEPAAQGRQVSTVAAPTAALAKPEGHCEHASPVAVAYVPLPHGWHAGVPAAGAM